jgi:hypothetical protein
MEQDRDKDRNVDHPVDLAADHHHFSHLAFDHFQELERVLEATHANDCQNLKLIHLRIAARAQADPLVHSPFSVPDC